MSNRLINEDAVIALLNCKIERLEEKISLDKNNRAAAPLVAEYRAAAGALRTVISHLCFIEAEADLLGVLERLVSLPSDMTAERVSALNEARAAIAKARSN